MAAYEFIDQTGIIVADTGAIRAEVEQEFRDVFGQDIDLSPQTPLGILATAETLARDGLARNDANLANQINPNQAGGIFLDGIGGLTGMVRTANTFSQTTVNYTGVAGTVAPLGLRLRNENGDLFRPLTAVTLDSNGLASTIYEALDPGPIAAPANTLNQFDVGEFGIETATNPQAATLGVIQQSDFSFRSLRRNTIARQGRSMVEAVTSAVNAVTGVTSRCQFIENFKSITQTIKGVTLVSHSIYVCVAGGADNDIANALYKSKTGGTGYNNGPGINISVDVTDPISHQVLDILFDRPNLIATLARVTVRANAAITDIPTAVKQAILNYAAGDIDPDNGFFIGSPVSCFELAAAVAEQVPGLYVKNVETSLADPIVFSNDEIPIAVFEQATIEASGITVVIE